jgi:membrane-bound metal-dependent hydrolase YbcI (DUF457 family)
VDLFTHVLVAYLVTYGVVGFQPSYLAAGAIAGGLPDGDILLWPLSKRFPIFRHHGITHSLLGVTIVATVGAVVAPMLAPGSALVYFGVIELGGIAHILMDGFTNFSVPPLMPFSKRALHIDADRAVNLVTMVISIASFYLLLGVERNRVPFPVYTATVWGLIALFAAYFAIRLAGRYLIGRHLGAFPKGAAPIPRSDPFRWLVVSEETLNGWMTITYARYTLGRGLTAGPLAISAPLEPPVRTGPVQGEKDALERSFGLARRASRMLADSYMFGEAHAAPGGGWSAIWYSLEFSGFGRAAGARVDFASDGTAQVKAGWQRATPPAPASA